VIARDLFDGPRERPPEDPIPTEIGAGAATDLDCRQEDVSGRVERQTGDRSCPPTDILQLGHILRQASLCTRRLRIRVAASASASATTLVVANGCNRPKGASTRAMPHRYDILRKRLRGASMTGKRTVVSVRELGDVTVIEGGGTLVMRLIGSEGQTLHILVPAKLGTTLAAQIVDASAKAASQHQGQVSKVGDTEQVRRASGEP
jgi:hypothetical protein